MIEMWSRPTLKPPAKGGLVSYGSLTMTDLSALELVQMNLNQFKARTSAFDLHWPSDATHSKLRASLTILHLQAHVGAWAQFESQE